VISGTNHPDTSAY